MSVVKHLTVGNTVFNIEALEDLTKENFFARYKGIISMNMEEAWKLIEPYTKYKVSANVSVSVESDEYEVKKKKKKKYDEEDGA